MVVKNKLAEQKAKEDAIDNRDVNLTQEQKDIKASATGQEPAPKDVIGGKLDNQSKGASEDDRDENVQVPETPAAEAALIAQDETVKADYQKASKGGSERYVFADVAKTADQVLDDMNYGLYTATGSAPFYTDQDAGIRDQNTRGIAVGKVFRVTVEEV